jgi:cell division septation protein DedD
MVGRGVKDATLAAGGTSILSGPAGGETVKSGLPPAEVRRELDFPQRLEADRVDARLEDVSSNPEKMIASATQSQPVAESSPSEASKPATAPPPKPKRKKASGGKRPAAAPTLIGSSQGAFTIQVVALKTEDAATSLVNRLQGLGYRAYLEPPGGTTGLHRVRVGRFDNRPEAEQVAQKLREVEKFKPYITQ